MCQGIPATHVSYENDRTGVSVTYIFCSICCSIYYDFGRIPRRHRLNQADGFGFKFRFKLRGCVANNLYVRETSVNFNNECNDYPSSDSFLLGFRWVLYVSLYPRKKSCISTRKKGRMSPTSYTLPLAFDSRIFFSLASAISLASLAFSLASLAFVSLSIAST